MLERTDLFQRQARALRNWQLLAFLLTVADVVLLGGFVRLALATRFVPFIVEVDPHGKATYAGPLEALDTPEERLVIQQLRQFLWNVRAVVADPIAQQELVARAYALADVPVRRALDRHFSRPENDPRLLAARASRSVPRITILRLPGTADTYQVQWTEVLHYRTTFRQSEERSYQGLLTVTRAERLPPEALAHNPLGLLVTELTWTETTQDSPT